MIGPLSGLKKAYPKAESSRLLDEFVELKVLKDKFDSEGLSESPTKPFLVSFESLGETKKFCVSLDFLDFVRSDSSGGKVSKISFRW